MSLRRRLAVVLFLGLSALIIAAAAIVHLFTSTNAARERLAEGDAEAGAQALAERVDASMLAGPPTGELRHMLHTTAASVLRPLPSSAGGYCTRDGGILAAAGRPNRGAGRDDGWRDGPRRRVSPEVEDAVSALCAKARRGHPARGRIEHPRGVDLVVVIAVGDRGAAWFLARLRGRGGEDTPAWPFEVVLVAIAATALAAFTIDAMIALRRGADDLEAAMRLLKDDLRAPLPKPRAAELGAIAAGLGSMATHLADARDRERELASKLSREQRLAALGRVAAGVAHEVRNPLAGMKLRLDMLARTGNLDGAPREDVEVCLGEIARLNRLVESLLTVSRAKTLTPRELLLAELADARVARARAAADRAGVRLLRRGEATASADPDALSAAIDNLLRNAIEASPRGATVLVDVGVDRGVVVVDVIDAGPGIPEARRAELFEPFFTTKPDGTGLGLWISRLLLEAKGATLGYERVGDRTRMRITFPRG